MRNLHLTAAGVLFAFATALQGVEYGGEKTDLIATQIQYKVCVVPPQIDDAIAKGVEVVSVKQAKALYDDAALFFDARSPRHYATERIKGAHPVTFDASKAEYIALHLPADRDKELLFYCYGESCAASYEAALAVREKGYTKVFWLLNGFPQWKKLNYPVEGGR